MQPHAYWQDVYTPGSFTPGITDTGFVAQLADGRQIILPVRPLADGKHALASLIINQASFAAQDALAEDLAARVALCQPDVIVGLPTLGLTLASAVARALGHARYVPLGTSRKFWYRDELSVALSSITTPDQAKSLYIDPRMLPLVEGCRVALIDDVISSGTSIKAGLSLLSKVGISPVVIGAAMLQSSRWRSTLDADVLGRIVSVFTTPMLEKAENGSWHPVEAP